MQSPDNVIIIEDLQTQTQLQNSPGIHPQTQTLALTPLRSIGRWQGFLAHQWLKPHHLNQDDIFILQQLQEPLAAVVASRRAYLGQQETLTINEVLYRTGRRFNEASSLMEIAAAVGEEMPLTLIDRVILMTFEYDSINELESIGVIASWHRYPEYPATPVGTHYSKALFQNINLLNASEPTLVSDALVDERIDAAMKDVFKRQTIQALVAIPITLSGKQIGSLILESKEKHEFTSAEIRPYLSLTSQIATALDNQRLLAETQEALSIVEETQQRYTLQAWDDYRQNMSTLFIEKVRADTLAMGDEIPPDILDAQQTGKTTIIKGNPNQEEAEDNEQTGTNLVIPLSIQEQPIGVLGLQETNSEHEWSAEEIAFVEAIAEQFAQTAENLRLIDETQQRAAREQRVNEISEMIDSAQTIEEALEIAITQVGQSLQATQTQVNLEIQEDTVNE